MDLVHDTTITDDFLVTGAQWRLFYQTLWPKDWYIDDITIDFEDENGHYVLDDDSVNKLGDFGYVGYQGKDKRYDSNALFPVRMLFEAVMLPKMKTHETVSFCIPKNKKEAFLKMAEEFGFIPF